MKRGWRASSPSASRNSWMQLASAASLTTRPVQALANSSSLLSTAPPAAPSARSTATACGVMRRIELPAPCSSPLRRCRR